METILSKGKHLLYLDEPETGRFIYFDGKAETVLKLSMPETMPETADGWRAWLMDVAPKLARKFKPRVKSKGLYGKLRTVHKRSVKRLQRNDLHDTAWSPEVSTDGHSAAWTGAELTIDSKHIQKILDGAEWQDAFKVRVEPDDARQVEFLLKAAAKSGSMDTWLSPCMIQTTWDYEYSGEIGLVPREVGECGYMARIGDTVSALLAKVFGNCRVDIYARYSQAQELMLFTFARWNKALTKNEVVTVLAAGCIDD